MGTSEEIREFLTSRRAGITPEQPRLPVYGGKRRESGLRREEVALLAGISVEYYYTRLERGNARGMSESVGWYVPATACSSSPARTTGTAPRQRVS